MLRILGGSHRNRRLAVPKTGLRPSMAALREALFNILAPHIEGARLLDLFAGSGAVGLEALSRGAKEVLFVERDRRGSEVIKKNLQVIGEEGTVVTSDVIRFLEHFEGEPFDVVFADPPYAEGQWGELLGLLDNGLLLRGGGFCFMEGRKGLKLPELETLEFVKARRYGSSSLYQWKKMGSLSQPCDLARRRSR